MMAREEFCRSFVSNPTKLQIDLRPLRKGLPDLRSKGTRAGNGQPPPRIGLQGLQSLDKQIKAFVREEPSIKE
jgi:hypothetical protein